MRILVTGSDGFIGFNLKLKFESLGHQVDGYEWGESMPDVSVYDLVCHLGAISATTCRDFDQILTQNYYCSIYLIEECNKHGIPFQYASSASVYGNDATTFKEDDQLHPASYYATSKYLFDRYVENEEWDIPVQGFRYFNVYGYEPNKGDQSSPVHKFTEQAQTGKIKIFKGSDKFKRDFVCVHDVCEVHVKMAELDVSGIFNVGTGEVESFSDVAFYIAEKYNSEVVEIPFPRNLKGQYQKYTRADNTKLLEHIDMEWTSVKEYLSNNQDRP